MTLILASLVGGLLYWFRGRGGFGLGTQAHRFVWAVPTGVLIAFLTWGSAPLWAGLLTILTAFLGMIVTGHGEHMDLGRKPVGWSTDKKPYETATFFFPHESTFRNDLEAMAWIGFLRGALTVLPVVVFAPWVALVPLAMTLQGIFYEFGWRLVEAGMVQDPLPIAEFLTGVLFWAALVLALV